jgi:hypothetical protein
MNALMLPSHKQLHYKSLILCCVNRGLSIAANIKVIVSFSRCFFEIF